MKTRSIPNHLLALFAILLLLASVVSFPMIMSYQIKTSEKNRGQTAEVELTKKGRFWWPASGKYIVISSTSRPSSTVPFVEHHLWVTDEKSEAYPVVIESESPDNYVSGSKIRVTLKADGGTLVEGVN